MTLTDCHSQAARTLDTLASIHRDIRDRQERMTDLASRVREAKERLGWEVEPQLRAQATEGRNEAQRENIFRSLALHDPEWQAARNGLLAAEAALSSAEADRNELLEQSRNARASARLLAALLGATLGDENGYDE